MVNTPRSGLSSVFDDMLVQNRKRFDDLDRSGRPRAGEAAAGAKSSVGRDRKTSPPTANVSAALDPESSPATRRLNERFGDDWRFEITARQRDGDEAIVLCKLYVGKDGMVRSQFGRARISGPVAGASGGVRFKLDTQGAERDERDAFRRATEAALTNCADLISSK